VKFEPVKLLHVYYKPNNEKVLVGRLALKTRKLFFEYDAAFITRGLNLSPFKLPLEPGVILSKDPVFEGLFGVFNDSLPDGWGRLLLDRKLVKYNVNPGALSPLDRLGFVGQQGMGALYYEPESAEAPLALDIELEQVSKSIREFQENDDERFVELLLNLSGASAGVRPKALLNLDGDNWIIKFKSPQDPNDIGNIEYAYHLMAMAANLEVPEAKLFPSIQGTGFFGTKRFDRNQGKSTHMLTISGLLHADHRVPSLDYATILKATMHLTRDMRECVKQFRRCVFNVLSHNRDDHAKNFSFLMDADGVWRVSPAYDLTFSSGPSGEHCSMIMGEGKNPGLTQLVNLAAACSIKKQKAQEIIDEVTSTIKKWPVFADQAKVSTRYKKIILSSLSKLLKDNF
jgi:serine/threonine-protein kinase HipA